VKSLAIWKEMSSGEAMTGGITEITAEIITGTTTAIFQLTLVFRRRRYSYKHRILLPDSNLGSSQGKFDHCLST